MLFAKKTIDSESIYFATELAKGQLEWIIDLAKLLKEDPHKIERRKKALCKPCFYNRSRIGGAAMTFQPCGICGEEMPFGNTVTDSCCTKCALENNLCKHCGGDIEMRQRRKPRAFQQEGRVS